VLVWMVLGGVEGRWCGLYHFDGRGCGGVDWARREMCLLDVGGK
jgi:hypothetical protein